MRRLLVANSVHLGSSPMLVECRLTVERRNALGVLLGDSRIVVDASHR